MTKNLKAEVLTDDDLEAVAGGTYLKYELKNVFVKSWSTSGDADDRPTEEVSLGYTKVEWT